MGSERKLCRLGLDRDEPANEEGWIWRRRILAFDGQRIGRSAHLNPHLLSFGDRFLDQRARRGFLDANCFLIVPSTSVSWHRSDGIARATVVKICCCSSAWLRSRSAVCFGCSPMTSGGCQGFGPAIVSPRNRLSVSSPPLPMLKVSSSNHRTFPSRAA